MFNRIGTLNRDYRVLINALSFYRSKMILDCLNCFGLVQIGLVGSNLFWKGPNYFGQVQIRLFFYNLDPTKTIGTHPK